MLSEWRGKEISFLNRKPRATRAEEAFAYVTRARVHKDRIRGWPRDASRKLIMTTRKKKIRKEQKQEINDFVRNRLIFTKTLRGKTSHAVTSVTLRRRRRRRLSSFVLRRLASSSCSTTHVGVGGHKHGRPIVRAIAAAASVHFHCRRRRAHPKPAITYVR